MNDTSFIKEPKLDLSNEIKAYEKQYIELIRQRLGIAIKHHQMTDLYQTIKKACARFEITPQVYLQNLLISEDNSPELAYLVSGITIGETYFFRDSHQMSLLQEKILPTLIQNKRAQNNLALRIWSSGCASGEEIYTIAMMLNELLPDIEVWNISLLGTDINTISLRKAMDGIFTDWSMRSISPYYKHKYFTQQHKNFYIHQSIREKVCFEYLNLNDDMYPSMFNNTNAQDLILCRNVLIYFDGNHILRLMKKLNASLIDGGFILLGASDPIVTNETTLFPYEREGALLQNKLQVRLHPKPSFTPILEYKTQELPPVKHHTHSGHRVEKTEQIVTQSLTQLLDESLSYANMGQLGEANASCMEILKKYPTNDIAHFTLAMILDEQNKLDEAEKALRKTIFLNHKFVAAHFKLGLILLRNNQSKEGLKYLNNALSIAINRNPSELVEGFSGFEYRKLSEILKREIDLHRVSGGN